jgi:hypothetical protein
VSALRATHKISNSGPMQAMEAQLLIHDGQNDVDPSAKCVSRDNSYPSCYQNQIRENQIASRQKAKGTPKNALFSLEPSFGIFRLLSDQAWMFHESH